MGRAVGGPTWSHWLLWWRIDADELRRQVEGYETLGLVGSARGRGFLLAMLSAAVLASVGFLAVADHMRATNYLCLAVAVCFLILGRSLYRGSAAAALGLMALCSFDRAMEFHLSMGGMAQRQPGLWLLAALVGWSIYMHCFWLAYRIEQERAATAAAPAAA